MFDEILEGYAPTEIDLMLKDLKDKIKDECFAELNSEAHSLELQLGYANKRIEELTAINNQLLDEVNKRSDFNENQKTAALICNNLILNITRDNFIKFLEFMYGPAEFDERSNTLWAEAIVRYYSRKAEVVKIMKAFNLCDKDADFSKFRLPHEWTAEEIKYALDHMSLVCNTNGADFKDNLDYSKHCCTWSVKEIFKQMHAQVMMQFLCRNPHLLEEENLQFIAEHIGVKGYGYFAHLDHYQEMTNDQKYLLAHAITAEIVNESNKGSRWYDFAMRNIGLIDNDEVLELLAKNLSTYEIRYNRKYQYLPIRYREYIYKKLSIQDLSSMIADDNTHPACRVEMIQELNRRYLNTDKE